MSTGNDGLGNRNVNNKLRRVMGFIDGFNLYHALDRFDDGENEADKARFQKYKWLCLTSLIKKYIAPKTEQLVGVEYFTTYPNWDEQKRLRHRTYVSVQIKLGVHVTFGEFKKRTVECRAECLQQFTVNEEKQTDVNIAVSMLNLADQYDNLILLTADSDQVPTLKLLKKLYPEKILACLPPIGRRAKELNKECIQHFKMTEQHLAECQLPNPFPIIWEGKQSGVFVKPDSWA